MALVALSLHAVACASSSPAPRVSRPVELGVGSRVGFTMNNDQLVLGPDVELAAVGFERLAFALPVLIGMGDNYLTGRVALQARPRLIDAGPFILYPTAGVSAQIYGPVGPYAEYCARYEIEACSGAEVGPELGGGLRYGWLGVDAVAGLLGLPVLTVVASVVVPFDTRLRLLRGPLGGPP